MSKKKVIIFVLAIVGMFIFLILVSPGNSQPRNKKECITKEIGVAAIHLNQLKRVLQAMYEDDCIAVEIMMGNPHIFYFGPGQVVTVEEKIGDYLKIRFKESGQIKWTADWMIECQNQRKKKKKA